MIRMRMFIIRKLTKRYDIFDMWMTDIIFFFCLFVWKTDYLFRNVIPDFAPQLCDKMEKADASGTLLHFSIEQAIHEKGISVRHLGGLRAAFCFQFCFFLTSFYFFDICQIHQSYNFQFWQIPFQIAIIPGKNIVHLG